MTAVVSLDGVRVTRGTRTVLDVPALAVEAGEVLGIMGPNGAGKSTLLRVLGLLESPDAGAVRFRGEAVTVATGLPLRRRMASVFQDPLLADGTVFDNVALGLRFRGVARDDVAPRVARWLARFGIADLAARRARTLSGGEAQRAALARALAVEPELLLLDEPFSALDQPTRDALLRDLRGILSAERVTTVLVTHHRGEALALGDRLAVMIGGAILQVGAAAQVFRAPVSAEVASFVGLETVVEGVAIGAGGPRSSLQVGAHRIEVAEPIEPGARALVCVRAEDVGLDLEADGPTSPPAQAGVNRLTGRVTNATPTPLHVRVTVDCGFPLVALVTHRLAGERNVREGMAVTAMFSAAAVHLIRADGAPRSDAARQGPRLDTASRRGV